MILVVITNKIEETPYTTKLKNPLLHSEHQSLQIQHNHSCRAYYPL